jgi:hypothetical protein
MRLLVSLILTVWLAGTQARGADDLPPRAVARLGGHRFYHGPGVTCAVLSPDGQRAASAAEVPVYFRHVVDKQRDAHGRVIILWDTATGERIRDRHARGGEVFGIPGEWRVRGPADARSEGGPGPPRQTSLRLERHMVQPSDHSLAFNGVPSSSDYLILESARI